MALPPEPGLDPDEPSASDATYRIFNIGNSRPVELLDYVRTLEDCLGRKTQLQLLPMQPGDIAATTADVTRLQRAIGYRPVTSVAEGVSNFVDWYVPHYGIAL
jgi:UDP-glucuronate 4-epimerase